MIFAQISDALAPENQPDATQLANTTYLMEQFQNLVTGLENPLAVSGGGSVFSYAPCFVNFAPAGAPNCLSRVISCPSLCSNVVPHWQWQHAFMRIHYL